ncbi:MAG: M28 family peptidase [Deltaproteobacteria bacterium]|nr:M28 family peptidase [Deltaproteobacteria bacterium]
MVRRFPSLDRGCLLAGCLLVAGFGSCGKPVDGSGGRHEPRPEHTAWQEALWVDALPPRHVGHPERLAALEQIAARLRGYGFEAELKRFRLPDSTPHWGGMELANLVARRGPTCQQTILLGTHWDTRAVADEEIDPVLAGLPVPGFNDGTSGVAVLLDIARRMQARTELPFGIEIVMFDAEEGVKGTDLYFTGSKRFASELAAGEVACYRAAVVFDMVADRDYLVRAEDLSFRGYPWLYEELFRHGDRAVFRPEPGRMIFDDHLALMARGIPSALVIDLDYPHWHKRTDTKENCSPVSLQQTADMAVRWLEEMIARGGEAGTSSP